MERAFRSSPWPLYGLPVHFPCRRFLAGWGRSGNTTTNLELGHLPPDGSIATQLRVEVTSTEDLAQDREHYARGLWLRAQLLSVEDKDLDSMRQRMNQIESDYEQHAQITWSDVTFAVDDVVRHGKQAALDDEWVTLVDEGSTSLVISGQRWADHTPDLVTIRDVEPYVRGRRQIADEG